MKRPQAAVRSSLSGGYRLPGGALATFVWQDSPTSSTTTGSVAWISDAVQQAGQELRLELTAVSGSWWLVADLRVQT